MYSEICEVIKNEQLVHGIFKMTIKSKDIAEATMPGQFVHIKVNAGLYPLLRRPISVHRADKAQSLVEIVYHVVGQGTEEFSKLTEGNRIDVMGPLGKGFPVFSDKKCAVVGGGIGTAPLLELAENLDNCDAYLGFRDCVYTLEAFEQSCNAVFVTTEDGSVGHKGYITEQLEKHLAKYEVVYTCGPKPMMQAVVDLCGKSNIECYVSVEERMGCGIGACLVCACKIAAENGQWHHMKACKDGPVFNGKEVLFND